MVGFIFDQAKCTGCKACILACTIENRLGLTHSWRDVYTFNDRHFPGLPVLHLSLACNHCEDPACLRACPANAYSKDPETGFVVLDEDRCIGCRYCTWVCPYGAPRYELTKRTVGKCTFCAERQSAGNRPACVELCPTGALDVTSNNTLSNIPDIAGFPHTNLGPAISVVPAVERRPNTDHATATTGFPFVPATRAQSLREAVGAEWPLVVFSYLVPILFALLATPVFVEHEPSPALFVAGVALAALVSSAHLGQKARAWRVVLNPMRSWLSREILLFGALTGVGAVYLGFAPGSRAIGALVFTVGLATLLSIDGVYAVLPTVARKHYHSSGAVLTWVFLAGVFTASPLVAGVAGASKLLLYLCRKIQFYRTGRPGRQAASLVRVTFGFLLPLCAWWALGRGGLPYVLVGVLLGELIDRLEFYAELDLLSPERQMGIDLRRAISAKSTAKTS
jgi:DMSO reductase iron-sulfur subunit